MYSVRKENRRRLEKLDRQARQANQLSETKRLSSLAPARDLKTIDPQLYTLLQGDSGKGGVGLDADDIVVDPDLQNLIS